MDLDEKIEIRDNLKEISAEAQGAARMIGSVRMLGPTKEVEPRFDLEGLKTLAKTLKMHAKAIKTYTKLLEDESSHNSHAL